MTSPDIEPIDQPNPEKYLILYPYGQEGLERGVNSLGCCVDARCPHHLDKVLGNKVYFQVAGGIHGLGTGVGYAKEKKDPGSTEGIASDEFGYMLASAALRELGLRYNIHEECVAIEGDEAVNNRLATDTAGDLVQNTVIIEPTYETDEHELFVAAAARRALEVKRPEHIYQKLRRSLGEMSARAATLRSNGLRPRGFVIVQETGYAFDVNAANEDGNPYYSVTREPISMLAPLTERLFGVDPSDFVKAMGVYHATVQATLERVKNIDLPITTLGNVIY